MFGKLIKFDTTFVQTTLTDSEIILIKNRGKVNLFCALVCAIVPDCNKDISQTRAGFDLVRVASIQISEFLDVPLQR